MGTLRFFEEVVSFKIRRTFGFADYRATVVAMFRKNMAAVARQGAKSAVMFRSYGSDGKLSASGCG